MSIRLAFLVFALGAALIFAPMVLLAQDRSQAEAPLFDRLGGLTPISVVVSDFIDVLVPDPQLNRNPTIAAARERVPAPYLKYHVTAFMCEATGDPCTYHGRDMYESHAHLNITEEEWDRMIVLFQNVLEQHDVPEREASELKALVKTTKDDIVTGSGAGVPAD